MDLFEDRLAASGQHEAFSTAIEKFRNTKRKTRAAQNTLYETLTNLGASPEEADEMINLEMEPT